MNCNSMKKFGLIGVGGFVAQRHLAAIKGTGNDLLAACDITDSVGILDSYFPNSRFFVEFERFDRFIDKLRRAGSDTAVDYISVCSPNYLHDAHVRWALRSGCHAICEKPLVLSPWNLDGLNLIENENGRTINTILQLRVHPAIIKLKEKLEANTDSRKFDVDLTYITPRGAWYGMSWKGDQHKSGGITSNIGIHFFDLLIWLFGSVQDSRVHLHNRDRASGFLELANARVRWFLSLNREDLPEDKERLGNTFRSITVNGAELEFSGGFKDLHTLSYEHILAGKGFGVDAARPSIELTHSIRTSTVVSLGTDSHPLLQRTQK